MIEDRDGRFVDPFVRVVGILSLIALLLPFAIYGVARLSGHLPTSQEWFYAGGHNHGPWRWSLPGILIGTPLLLLIPVTVFGGIVRNWKVRGSKILAGTVWLALLQVGALYLQLRFLFWTID